MGSTLNATLPAALVGITTAIAYSSANLGISLMAIPALLVPQKSLNNVTSADDSDAPLLARQWQAIYSRGHRLGPATVIFGTSSFIYAASKLPEADTTRRGLLFTSAGLTIAAFPYTWFCMLQVNNELHRRAGTLGTSWSARATTQSDRIMVDRALPGLIEAWASRGVIRALWPLAAAIVASIAMLM